MHFYGGDNRLSVISLKYPKKLIKVNLGRFLFMGFEFKGIDVRLTRSREEKYYDE